MTFFSTFLRKLFVGTPWGEVYPPRLAPPPPAVDGRTAALRILRRFISELTFYREEAVGKPTIPFQISADRIHIEWPDAEDEERVFPQVAFISSGLIEHQTLGLGSFVDDVSQHVHGRNTALQANAQYVEILHIESICTTKHERRALRDCLLYTSPSPRD